MEESKVIEQGEVCAVITDLRTCKEQECDTRTWVAAAGSRTESSLRIALILPAVSTPMLPSPGADPGALSQFLLTIVLREVLWDAGNRLMGGLITSPEGLSRVFGVLLQTVV